MKLQLFFLLMDVLVLAVYPVLLIRQLLVKLAGRARRT